MDLQTANLGPQRLVYTTWPIIALIVGLTVLSGARAANADLIRSSGDPAQLSIRVAGPNSVRITLAPLDAADNIPANPALVEREKPPAILALRELDEAVDAQVGNLQVHVQSGPLTVKVTDLNGRPIQEVVFQADGRVRFKLDDQPVLGMGEGGPLHGDDWRDQPVEFDRRGRLHPMRPRWQGQAYGSRNPVALLIGTSGWAIYMATPWGQVDLRDGQFGYFQPWQPPQRPGEGDPDERRRREYGAQTQGRPPVDSIVPGLVDFFVFDAADPKALMKDLAAISGFPAMPPKWTMGYVQSHRTLEDDSQMVRIVDTFREKQIPLDAVIYLGTGFCPRGWNTPQPSLEFNPEVFQRSPAEVMNELHERNVKVVVHVVPPGRDRLPTLHGSIPPQPTEETDASHIINYWKEHEPLMAAGVDAFWPDEGDWFNLFERIKRHQLYYQGPLSTRPNVRPWSLHRNGHLGIARWGGWVWSGDTESSWKTLEAQIAVGVNHSLSLSPYWGSDIGGFYPGEELDGEMYARWFQFGAFCPSFRSHGRTWWLRLPWGWGLDEMGPLENRVNPPPSVLGNREIEPICKKYAELRYQLLPYNYTLARQATDTGLPLMRAMWLHYPDDTTACATADQYLWGDQLLIAPVYEPGATTRKVYLPKGSWYDWWTGELHEGSTEVERQVDLETMPIYAKAGVIIPLDPVRQYVDQPVDEPTTLRIYTGASGEFLLYEDDGNSLDYQNGTGSWIRIAWDEDARTLLLAPSSRSTTSAVTDRMFRIEFLPEKKQQEVQYGGQPLKLQF